MSCRQQPYKNLSDQLSNSHLNTFRIQKSQDFNFISSIGLYMTYKSYSNLETRCLKLQMKSLFHSFSDTFSSDQTVIDQERKCIDNTDIQTYELGLSQIWNLQDKCSPSKHKIYHAWVPTRAEENIEKNQKKLRENKDEKHEIKWEKNEKSKQTVPWVEWTCKSRKCDEEIHQYLFCFFWFYAYSLLLTVDERKMPVIFETRDGIKEGDPKWDVSIQYTWTPLLYR